MYGRKILSERKGKTTEARNYFLKVFTDDSESGVGKTNERSMAKALFLYEGEGMGATLASSEGTAFGLLNAATKFVDHERRTKTAEHPSLCCTNIQTNTRGKLGVMLKSKRYELPLL